MKKRFYILLLISFLLSLADVQAQQKATPKAGEGISTFLLRHNRAPKKYYDDFVELNKAKLGKGNVLKLGVTYTIPPVKRSAAADKETPARKQSSKASKIGTTLHEPLFGKQLANVKVTSNRLAGACFYVVSGHGGPDPGAIGRVGKHELHEDEYAYDVMLRLARNLLMRGAKVHIIIQDAKDGIRNDRFLNNTKRETCMGTPIPFNQVRRLEQRSEKINSLFKKDKELYKRAIFMHIDSRSKSHQTDVFFYYQDKNSESKHLAKTMKSTFEHKYNRHQPGRGFTGTVGQRGLYVLRKTTPPSVFVELGNIQNSFDQKRFILSDNRQALANWLCEGFVTDYKRYKKKLK